MRVLVTGSAGFIGFHLAKRLLADGHQVTGIDALTPYYDVSLKVARHAVLERHGGFTAHVETLENAEALSDIVSVSNPDMIVHLAAQAGVRYSLENPKAYIDSNIVGTFNVLEAAKAAKVGHLLMASTSSVYGANAKTPFSETDAADTPLTLYAATKKSTELMAHAYSHLWSLPVTMFRFFTVYGPWGRPDMALFKFVKAMLADQPIELYNGGAMQRDFTYIDDLIEGIVRLMACVPDHSAPEVAGDTLSPVAPYRVVNIGGGAPVPLTEFVEQIECALARRADRENLPMQPGDVPSTVADARLIKALTGFQPATPVSVGIAEFVRWYRAYYDV